MKRSQNTVMPVELVYEIKRFGERIARMRKARRIIQSEVAVRANISRETASRIENGDASVAVGQILRYINAISPGATFKTLYESDPAIELLAKSEKRQRVRRLTPKELLRYDF